MPRGDMNPSPAQRAKYLVKTNPENLEQAIAGQIAEAVRELLARLGAPGFCGACGRAIYWVHTTNDGRRRVPFSVRGVPHTADCNMAGGSSVRLDRWQ